MAKKIITIGQCTDQKRNVFSGQAMMFEAFVTFLKEKEYDISVINLTSKYTNIKVGKIVVKRILEYLFIIFKAVPTFIKGRGGVLYITTAQTKGGFLRDLVFIHLASLLNCKILIQQFGSNFEVFYKGLSPVFKYFVRNTFNKGSYIIVEGAVTKRQFAMLEDFEKKVISITNGLPEKTLKISLRGKMYNNKEAFNLIYLNYMIESKGYWDVLEAVNILVNEFERNIKCTFAGMFKPSVDDQLFETEKEAEIAFFSFIEKNNLSKSVIYHVGLMGEKKANAFLSCHSFLLPSYFKFEGQPVSVLEAMAYGAVPIVTNYRMIPEMVTADTGLFVEKKSPRQIAERVAFLMDHPDTYNKLSQASIDRFQKYFTLEKYCNNIFKYINSL